MIIGIIIGKELSYSDFFSRYITFINVFFLTISPVAQVSFVESSYSVTEGDTVNVLVTLSGDIDEQAPVL